MLRVPSSHARRTIAAIVRFATVGADAREVVAGRWLRGGGASARETRGYAWNELPQPQLFTAFGLSNVKPRFSMPS